MKSHLKSHVSKKKGFTLIELLVVIAIIGVLSAIVLASTANARERARDAQRMSDIRQINNAIQLYILTNNHAPNFGNPTCSDPEAVDPTCYVNDFNALGAATYTWAQFETELAPYIRKLPKDPCGAQCYNKRNSGPQADGFFTYRYTAPGESFGTGETGGATSSGYAIFAQNLETRDDSFGFGAGSF